MIDGEAYWDGGYTANPAVFPLFFECEARDVLLVLLNSLLHLPEVLVNTGHGLSRSFLVTAMAAIGIKTHLKDILSVGWKPVALMLLETVFLAVLVYMLLLQA